MHHSCGPMHTEYGAPRCSDKNNHNNHNHNHHDDQADITKPVAPCGPMHIEYGAPRGLKTATTNRREESFEGDDAMGQKTPPSAAFFLIYDEEDAEPEMWPPFLGGPQGPQGQDPARHRADRRSLVGLCADP